MKVLIPFNLDVLPDCGSESNVPATIKKTFYLFHAWIIHWHEPKWAVERESRNGKNNLETWFL
jgi:hypothetical protein